MGYQNAKITEKGRLLMQRVMSGETTFTFSKVALSDREYPNFNIKQSITVSTDKDDLYGTKVTAVFNNSGVSQKYNIMCIGVYAKDSNNEEILFSYLQNDGTCDPMEVDDGTTPIGYKYIIHTGLTEEDGILVQLNPDGYATEDWVKAYVEEHGGGSGTIPVQVLPEATAEELGKIYYLIPDRTYYAVQLISAGVYDWKRFVLAGGSGTGATINVNTHSINLFGAEVNLKYNNQVVDSTTFSAEGTATFEGITQTGIYTLEAVYDGQVDARKSVNVSGVATYLVTLTSGQLGGFLYSVIVDESNADPIGSVTYADDCEGFTPASKNTYGDWEGFVKSFFRPCLLKPTDAMDSPSHYLNHDNRSYYDDGTPAVKDGSEGDAMIQVSKLWYNFEQLDENRYKLSISDAKLDTAWECFNWYLQDGEYKEPDYMYLGCYISPAASPMRSIAGQPSTAAISSPANWRSYAAARGAGYKNYNMRKWFLIQAMMLLLGKTRNTQAAFGGAFKNAYVPSGSYDSQKFISQDCFLGIESLFDYKVSTYGLFIDGAIRSTATQMRWTDDIDKWGETAAATANYENAFATPSTSGAQFITKTFANNRGMFLPKAIGGSETTQYCDGLTANTGSTGSGGPPNPLYAGVGFGYDSSSFGRSGGFAVYAFSAFSHPYGSARLCRIF